MDDLARVLESHEFDAVFLAVGAHVSKHAPDIPSSDVSRILDALAVLRSVDAGDPPQLGREF